MFHANKLYSKTFYLHSVLGNLAAIAGGFFVLPGQLRFLLVPLVVVLLCMLVESYVRKFPLVSSAQTVAFWRSHWLTARYKATVVVGALGITLSTYGIKHPLVLYCPLVMYGIYNSFNSVMGSRFLTWVVRAFLVLNIALGLVQADSYQDCAVYVVFSAMILCAVHLIQTLTVTGMQEAEDTIGRATTANAVLGFMAQSARHDINNKLTLLEGAMWFTLGEEAMGKVHSQIMAISGLLDGLDATKRSTVDVHALAKGAYRAHYQDSSPESVRLDSSRTHYEIHESFVKSVVANLIENAVEAGKRKNLDPRVSVLVGDGYIEVEDHSGGFDVVGIREGKSAKARKGHGKFLAMLTDTTIPSLFGLSVEIAPTLDGTRFRVRFA